jgi:hypothetical protein
MSDIGQMPKRRDAPQARSSNEGTMQDVKGPAPIQTEGPQNRRRLAPIWRAIIEIGFIMFLFYSNLLMGEFTRSNSAHGKSFIFALGDILTLANFDIGIFSALIGYVVVEYLRGKL